jgi:hypothetical protein
MMVYPRGFQAFNWNISTGTFQLEHGVVNREFDPLFMETLLKSGARLCRDQRHGAGRSALAGSLNRSQPELLRKA